MHDVSRRSWHYKLYRYIRNISEGPRYVNPWVRAPRKDVEVPHSLCPYFWQTFLGCIGAIFLGMFVLLGVAVVFAFHLVASAALYVGAVILALGSRLHARVPARAGKPPKAKSPPRAKRPSLVAARVRASRDRVCPTIRLVD